MSVDREAIETGIAAVYAASTYFSNTANCKKIEARFRTDITDYNLRTNGFERTTEVPAISVVEAIPENGFNDAANTEPIGYGGDVEYFVPIAVVAIYVASTYALARTGIRAILKEAAAVAETQITSALSWGTASAITEVDTIKDSYSIEDDGVSYIAKGAIKFSVRKR